MLTISELFNAVWTSNTNLTRQDFSKRLHLLRRVIRLNSDGTILLFHHSFGEWLLDAKHCTKKYLCSAEAGHGMLAMSYSLKAKQLSPEDVQNFALHLTRMPLPDESVVNFIEKTLNFDYNTILVLWLIQSGANVENCLLGQEKSEEIVQQIYEKENGLKKKSSDSIRKRTSSLSKKDQRVKLPKSDTNNEGKKKYKSRKHSSLKKSLVPMENQSSCHYEKLPECYEELQFEPYGRRDLDKEKRISEDYDHLDFDVKKPEKKTIASETNEILEKLTNLDLVIKKDETGFFESEKSPDFLKEFTEQNFKFSLESPSKTGETSFLNIGSQDSGFLKSEDTSTLGLVSNEQTTESISVFDEKMSAEQSKHQIPLTKEEELDILLNGLEKSLNEESEIFNTSFLSQITQKSLAALRNENCEEDESQKKIMETVTLNIENMEVKHEKKNEFSLGHSKSDKAQGFSKESTEEDSGKKETEGLKEPLLSDILEVLQVPKDPKVLKILTEAGAKVSNCNSLQKNEKSSSLDNGIDVASSQVLFITDKNIFPN